MPQAPSIQRHLESLFKELSELRAVKAAHDQLTQSYNDLARFISRAAGLNTTIARKAGPAGTGRKPGRPKGSVSKPSAGRKRAGGKRFRSTAADVQKAYDALAAKATREWATKEAICKAAGYKPDQVTAAWKRLMEGGNSADGKTVKPILESNGSRGLKGRYRRRA
ncbi:MAG: hypothetical protein KF724_01585 [Phycisphaeraceae bacterium]|nr:hypothetical protein [Phycisphaeraceae bacterium]